MTDQSKAVSLLKDVKYGGSTTPPHTSWNAASVTPSLWPCTTGLFDQETSISSGSAESKLTDEHGHRIWIAQAGIRVHL